MNYHILQKLQGLGKEYFTIDDLREIFKQKRESLYVTLNRGVKSGWLRRLKSGIYQLATIATTPANIEKAANQIYSPSYLSFESALAKYGILRKIPYTFSFATPRRTKRMKILGNEIVFRQLKKKLFFGYRLAEGVYSAEKEKALLDQLYLVSLGKSKLNLEGLNLKGISRKKVFEFAKEFPKITQKLVKTIFVIALVVFMFNSAFAYTKIANDPTPLSVGARVLGMGGSFAGIADDAAAIFVNPAGLGKIDDWQISSMSGKLMNLYNYVQLSALYPTKFGTFGIGYGGSSLEFHFPSAEVIDIGDETRIISSGEVSGKYSNTALLLSYGRELDFFGLQNLSLGGSLKLLAQDISLAPIASGSASGLELNLGALYPLTKDFSLALAVHNALPASLGGKIKWSTNTEETLPALLKLGLAYKISDEDAAADQEKRKLRLTADYDSYLTRTGIPGLFHAGLEWSPVEFVTLRTGIDQNLSANESGAVAVSNDLTYGISLLFRGFRFDYAYHTYFEIPDNATNYFSLSYGIWKEVPPEEKKKYFIITSPDKHSIHYDEKIIIKGRIFTDEVSKVVVQGKEAVIQEDKSFSLNVSLAAGKNSLLITAYDKKGKALKQISLEIIRLASFADLEKDYWAKRPIAELATLGIISGYPDGAFRPEESITRAELTTLLVKIKEKAVKEAEKQIFADVPVSHWAAKYIEFAVKQNLATGFPGPVKVFKPDQAISRAEGITIIARFAELPDSRLLEAPYRDIPGRHWAVAEVSSAKEAGFLDYIKGENFEPSLELKRGEVAYILSKTGEVKEGIKELMGGQ